METKVELSSNENTEVTLSFSGKEKWSSTRETIQEVTGNIEKDK